MNESTETTPNTARITSAVASPAPTQLPAMELPSQQKLVARPGKPRRAMTSGD